MCVCVSVYICLYLCLFMSVHLYVFLSRKKTRRTNCLPRTTTKVCSALSPTLLCLLHSCADKLHFCVLSQCTKDSNGQITAGVERCCARYITGTRKFDRGLGQILHCVGLTFQLIRSSQRLCTIQVHTLNHSFLAVSKRPLQ